MSEINHDNNVAMQYRKVWKKFHGLKKKIYNANGVNLCLRNEKVKENVIKSANFCLE